VQDYGNVKNTTLGKVMIPLQTYRDKQPQTKTFKLLGKDFEGGKDRGELDLTIQWVFDPQVNERMLLKKAKEVTYQYLRIYLNDRAYDHCAGSISLRANEKVGKESSRR
jgi:hypothetical protein